MRCYQPLVVLCAAISVTELYSLTGEGPLCSVLDGRGRMKPNKKLAAAAGLMIPLMILVSAPAWASMSESGSKTCSNSYQGVRSKTTLDTYVDPAGTGDRWYYTGSSSWATRNTYASSKGGGSWYVWAYGLVDGPGTYASCYTSLP